MKLVAVGSKNPVKVGAGRNVMERLFPGIAVQGIEVPSGVPVQPIGEEETAQGAINRARAAREALDADFGVGLEGGVAFKGHACWMVQYCAVADRTGRVSVAPGVQFLLPPSIGRQVRAGAEVGPLFDAVAGVANIKQKTGVIGFLTNGLVLREDMYTHMVAAAMVQFLHPELYAND